MTDGIIDIHGTKVWNILACCLNWLFIFQDVKIGGKAKIYYPLFLDLEKVMLRHTVAALEFSYGHQT